MSVNKKNTQGTNVSGAAQNYPSEIKTYSKNVQSSTQSSLNASTYGFFISDSGARSGSYSITSTQASYRNLNSKKP